VREY